MEAEVPFSDAVKTAVWLVVIEPVEMLNVAAVVFAGTVTEVGATRVNDALFASVTDAPPVGAA